MRNVVDLVFLTEKSPLDVSIRCLSTFCMCNKLDLLYDLLQRQNKVLWMFPLTGQYTVALYAEDAGNSQVSPFHKTEETKKLRETWTTQNIYKD